MYQVQKNLFNLLGLVTSFMPASFLNYDLYAVRHVDSLFSQIFQGYQMSQGEIQQLCNSAISATLDRFGSISNLRVANTEIIDLSEWYRNYPANAPSGVQFGLEGRAVNNVMNSPRLMTDISTRIISDCPSISWVRIGQYQSGTYATFGLINGRVSAFRRCADDSSPNLPNWGEVYCF